MYRLHQSICAVSTSGQPEHAWPQPEYKMSLAPASCCLIIVQAFQNTLAQWKQAQTGFTKQMANVEAGINSTLATINSLYNQRQDALISLRGTHTCGMHAGVM